MTAGWAFRLTCAGQALVVALGGGVAIARQTAHPSAPAVRTSSHPAAGGHNEARARQEADRLLSLTRVPDGARSIQQPPRLLSGPVMGTPMVTTIVIRSAYWHVPMSYSATLAWLQTHPPRDLTQTGSGGGIEGPDGSASGYDYSEMPSPTWQSAELEVAATADGDGSAIRADALVVWLDPKPVRDTADGTRVRVSVDGSCPSSDRGVVGVRNYGQRLTDRLLPDAQPWRGLVCWYDGGNGDVFGLVSTKRLDARQAASLADALRRLPLSHTDGGMQSCPMDDGAAAIVALAYPGVDDVDVWVTLNGCAFVSNGRIVTAAGTIPELIKRYR